MKPHPSQQRYDELTRLRIEQPCGLSLAELRELKELHVTIAQAATRDIDRLLDAFKIPGQNR